MAAPQNKLATCATPVCLPLFKRSIMGSGAIILIADFILSESAFQQVGVVSEIGCLNLDLSPVDQWGPCLRCRSARSGLPS